MRSLNPFRLILACLLVAVSACDTHDPEATNLAGIELDLVSPLHDSAVVRGEPVTFTWTLSSEPNGTFGYFYQISQSATFEEAITGSGSMNGYQSGLVLEMTRTLHPNPSVPPSEPWYFRIQMSADGYVSPWVERRFYTSERILF
ncbi:MAG: hypothetical protein R2834_04025 [Rhodothermales bacterium]